MERTFNLLYKCVTLVELSSAIIVVKMLFHNSTSHGFRIHLSLVDIELPFMCINSEIPGGRNKSKIYFFSFDVKKLFVFYRTYSAKVVLSLCLLYIHLLVVMSLLQQIYTLQILLVWPIYDKLATG